VDARHGHVFVGNLLVADEGFRRPLLNVEQTPALCGTLTDSQLAKLDGNVYVRRGDSAPRPLISWSPAAGERCTAALASPAALAALQQGFEARSRSLDGYVGAIFKSPELRNYRLAVPLAPAVADDPVPAEIRKAAGWPADAARAPGAYPAVRLSTAK
jgi:hypothetical protein